MSPRVTVATRTKNRPILLARALESVANQRFDDYELVIVNDAGELAPVERLAKEKLDPTGINYRIVDNPESRGREAAMNIGFEGSTADYLILHDDDDSWHPDFLEKTVAYLDEHPEAGGVGTRTAVIFESIHGEEVREHSRQILAEDLHEVTLRDILRANYVPPIALLFRRDVYEEIGPFDGALPVLADWEFTIRLLAAQPVGFIDGEPLAFWHHRRGATGDLGNSVVVAANDHASYNERIRDEKLRDYLKGGSPAGEILYLADQFRRLEELVLAVGAEGSGEAAERRLKESKNLDSTRTELEIAIGRLEGRQIETQLALARIEQIIRAGGPLQRNIVDGVRALSSNARPVLARATTRAGALGKKLRGRVAAAAASTVQTQAPTGEHPMDELAAPEAVSPASTVGKVERVAQPEYARITRGDARMPKDGRRAIIYFVYDPAGEIDDYVEYKLTDLRKHADYILAVSNGPLSAHGRTRLEGLVDEVFERENKGFDVWAYKEAQDHIGWDRLAEFDELILMNYTFFGPIYPFQEVFDRMDPSDVDFWGLTEHGYVDEHEFGDRGGAMPPHIQSHWIAVRGPMLRSPEYREYWDTMPMIESYKDSIRRHESRFTRHFNERGFAHLVAWPERDYPSKHPIFDDIVQMLDDRLPIVKRRLFFHDPLYLEKNVIIGRDVLERIERAGYPLEHIWHNIVRSSKPRALVTNMNQLDILPHEPFPAASGKALDAGNMPSIAVVMHLYYDDMLDEMLDRVDLVPGTPRLVITTSDEERAERIRAGLARRGWEQGEVRVVESNRGRDISAFYLACADVLCDESIDIIVKIHGKKSAQDGYNAAQWFKRHLLDNLLPSAGYTENLIAMFQRDETLGLVFPPVVNLGYPTLGHGWFTNLNPAKELAKKLGVKVPLDDATPLAPLGSMFIARREALDILVNAGFTWTDFPDEGGYHDGTLAHVVERFVAYAAAERGFRTATVMSPEMAAISHGFLEYRLQAVTHVLPGTTTDEIIHRAQNPGVGSLALMGMRWVNRKFPAVGKVMWPAYRGAVIGAKGARKAIRRAR